MVRSWQREICFLLKDGKLWEDVKRGLAALIFSYTQTFFAFFPSLSSFPIIHKLLKILFSYFPQCSLHPPTPTPTPCLFPKALSFSVSGLNLNKQSSLCSKTVSSPHPNGMLPPILQLAMVTGNLLGIRFYPQRDSKHWSVRIKKKSFTCLSSVMHYIEQIMFCFFKVGKITNRMKVQRSATRLQKTANRTESIVKMDSIKWLLWLLYFNNH